MPKIAYGVALCSALLLGLVIGRWTAPEPSPISTGGVQSRDLVLSGEVSRVSPAAERLAAPVEQEADAVPVATGSPGETTDWQAAPAWDGPVETVAVPVEVLQTLARGVRVQPPGEQFLEADDPLMGSLGITTWEADYLREQWQANLRQIRDAEVVAIEQLESSGGRVSFRRAALPELRSTLQQQFTTEVHSTLGDGRGSTLLALKGGSGLLNPAAEATEFVITVEEGGPGISRYRIEETRGDQRKVWIADAIPAELRHLTDAVGVAPRVYDPDTEYE
jgi:hypothetical protein